MIQFLQRISLPFFNNQGSCIIQTAMECDEWLKKDFISLVKEGGKVDPAGLRKRIDRSYRLGFCIRRKETLAVAALKVPYKDYKQRMFYKAGVERLHLQFSYELGWCFTKENVRCKGCCSRIIEELFKNTGVPCYATCGYTNEVMQHILKKNGFVQEGQRFRGELEDLVLYVRR